MKLLSRSFYVPLFRILSRRKQISSELLPIGFYSHQNLFLSELFNVRTY